MFTKCLRLLYNLQRDDIEDKMNCQVEQLIEMAKDELELIPEYACKQNTNTFFGYWYL